MHDAAGDADVVVLLEAKVPEDAPKDPAAFMHVEEVVRLAVDEVDRIGRGRLQHPDADVGVEEQWHPRIDRGATRRQGLALVVPLSERPIRRRFRQREPVSRV